ncbi:TPA: fimbrial protein [Escherichia coli]|nr:fimbrial protein [Escherichia coli]HCQ0091575.1 fimbrial protein [Escherichia coli]
MNKKLVALAISASAVISGSAMAWTNGNFNGSVDIGGNVTFGDNFSQKWMWKTGTGFDALEGKDKELTDGGKKLVITADKDSAILLGKTESAFVSTNLGSSAIPQIEFSDYQRTKVDAVFSNASNNGEGHLELPVVDATSAPIGKVKINMTAAGVRMMADAANTRGVVGSVFSGSSNDVFFGGLPKASDSTMPHGNTATSWVASMGGLSSAELLTQLKDVDATIVTIAANSSPVKTSMTDAVTSASYAMAVKKGQTMDMDFTNPITQTTAWKAPLNISVTYQ